LFHLQKKPYAQAFWPAGIGYNNQAHISSLYLELPPNIRLIYKTPMPFCQEILLDWHSYSSILLNLCQY